MQRPLTPSEIAALPEGLVAAVPVEAVRLIGRAHPLSWLSQTVGRGPLIVVRGRRIFWPDLPTDLSARPEVLALLAHELTHVWQYANGLTVWRYLWRERGCYRYRLTAGKAFTDYGYEQQAAMVEDWVRGLNGLPPRWGHPAEVQPLTDSLPFS
ncbi:hypothetical protein [Asticcacaulis excentricus]|uniref:DUF4157 domain-containing protein n=1 Tax=Asticcacaulis excentricus (strain ATCC 15261 / DSM 4724 / KCTC 12464 / NCIMB 9791 / VKM B-1370 / CB 48) TaxID=573065 RepID=E8RV00_ASTEC|nr:hypothetical protein [Asticcacaulis excentricus]ADU14200.1 hypothetical protein Astex_2550 [Asticcacaulis excentricus CB 48]